MMVRMYIAGVRSSGVVGVCCAKIEAGTGRVAGK